MVVSQEKRPRDKKINHMTNVAIKDRLCDQYVCMKSCVMCTDIGSNFCCVAFVTCEFFP